MRVIMKEDPSEIETSEGVKTTCMETNGSPATTLLREIEGTLDPHIIAGNVPVLVLATTRPLLSVMDAEMSLVSLNKKALSVGFKAFETVNRMGLSAKKVPEVNKTSSNRNSER